MKTISTAFWVTMLLVVAVAAGSFALSFQALKQVAQDNGVSAALAFIWPLIVDVSVIVYTLAILVAQLQRRAAKLPVALVLFYGAVTITGNIIHAPLTAVGWFVAALPPLSLILGTEMLRVMGRHIIEYSATLTTLQELIAKSDVTRRELHKIEGQITAGAAQLNALRDDINAAKADKNADFAVKMHNNRQAKIAERRSRVQQLQREGLEEMAIAAEVGIKDVRTIRRDLAAIATAGNGVK